MDSSMLVFIAAGVALVVGWIAGGVFRPSAAPAPDPWPARLRSMIAALAEGVVPPSDAAEPSEVTELRSALEQGWMPRNADREAALRQAFGRVAAFLENSVESPLKAVREGDADLLREGVDRALGGLADLRFYLREPVRPDETHNLVPLLQQVQREFVADWEIGVRFGAPATPVRAHIHSATFKDAVYLLLHNAGHFGGGQTVDLQVEDRAEEVRVVIRDRGPGFSDEALQRARDLFYTTRPEALGLGIPFARKVIEECGGRLEIRNPEESGAEVSLILPKA